MYRAFRNIGSNRAEVPLPGSDLAIYLRPDS